MRYPANTVFIVVAVGSGVVAIAFICANAFPWESPLPMSSASEITVTNYHHRCYGWPAIYASVTSHGSPRIIAEARFSLWALLVNLALVSSFAALIWTSYFILRAKRLSLAALFMAIAYIAVMVAAITQVRESSLPHEPTPHLSLSAWSSRTGHSALALKKMPLWSEANDAPAKACSIRDACQH
jgi:hypothetical protein